MSEYRCYTCGSPFAPSEWQIKKTEWQCGDCRRAHQLEWRQRRKEAGKPVKSGNMPREWHANYEAERNQKPVVRKMAAKRAKARRENPLERHKWIARIKLRQAISSGKIQRKPCERCGAVKSQGHHEDYSKPLDVQWLCPKHHAALHRAKATEPRP